MSTRFNRSICDVLERKFSCGEIEWGLRLRDCKRLMGIELKRLETPKEIYMKLLGR